MSPCLALDRRWVVKFPGGRAGGAGAGLFAITTAVT